MKIYRAACRLVEWAERLRYWAWCRALPEATERLTAPAARTDVPTSFAGVPR